MMAKSYLWHGLSKFFCIPWVQVDEVALSIKKHSSSLELSQMLVVCLIAWFAWAGLIMLGGVPKFPKQDNRSRSGKSGTPSEPYQSCSGK